MTTARTTTTTTLEFARIYARAHTRAHATPRPSTDMIHGTAYADDRDASSMRLLPYGSTQDRVSEKIKGCAQPRMRVNAEVVVLYGCFSTLDELHAADVTIDE